jgi:hypothetical protein
MRRAASRLPALLLVACLAGSPACVHGSRNPRALGDVDPRPTATTFIEEGNLVALVVGTRVTSRREDSAYVPLEIAVANAGLDSLTLNMESFILVDEKGLLYPAVGDRELRNGYGFYQADRTYFETPLSLPSTYQDYTRQPSSLSMMSLDRPVPRTVILRRFGVLVDFVYFPRPDDGVRGRRFELFMNAPELDDPVFVRFEVLDPDDRDRP